MHKLLLLIYKKMLNICHTVGAGMDVLFNAKIKSTLFVVGRAYDKVIDCLQIGNASIHWCTRAFFKEMLELHK